MKKLMIGAAILVALALALPAAARNVAFPTNDPAITLAVPDNWKTEQIDFGFSAVSPGKDVFFSLEYASGKKIDAMMTTNEEWMKENAINDKVAPEKLEVDFNGLKGDAFVYRTTDENGPTIVEFVILPGGKGRVMLLTLWGSAQERLKHKTAIEAILASVKPIN